jgi:hypothetical protein
VAVDGLQQYNAGMGKSGNRKWDNIFKVIEPQDR